MGSNMGKFKVCGSSPGHKQWAFSLLYTSLVNFCGFIEEAMMRCPWTQRNKAGAELQSKFMLTINFDLCKFYKDYLSQFLY